MNFEEYMNPLVLTNLMDQIKEEVAKKKKNKDVFVAFDIEENVLSVDVYWGKAGYAVYSYDTKDFKVNKENFVEKNREISEFVDKEDQRIFKILESNHMWSISKIWQEAVA